MLLLCGKVPTMEILTIPFPYAIEYFGKMVACAIVGLSIVYPSLQRVQYGLQLHKGFRTALDHRLIVPGNELSDFLYAHVS